MTKHELKLAFPFSSVEYNEHPFNINDIKVEAHTISRTNKPEIHSTFMIILVTKGKGIITINTVSYPVQKGTLLWLFPYHTYFSKSISEAIECLVFETTLNVLMYSSITSNTNQDFISFFEYNDVPLVQTNDHYEELAYLFTTSLTEYQERCTHFELILLGNFYKIIALFSRISHHTKPAVQKKKNNAWTLYQHLHYHFSESNISSVSKQFKLSAKEINTSLLLLTGKNFRENLMTIRMLNARSMMRFSDLSIDYIAKYVGYKSTPSFNRQFKKLTGMTPNEFRQHPMDTTHFAIHFRQSRAFDILQYLFEHYPEPLTSTNTATIFFSNSVNINQLLYDEFGYNFSQLLTFVRMIFAKNLVVLTNKKIIEISSATGYTSLRSFNRHFKELWQESPIAYRKKYGVPSI